MDRLPTKMVSFTNATIACSVAHSGAEFIAEGRAKPLRFTKDGILGVPYDDRPYPLVGMQKRIFVF